MRCAKLVLTFLSIEYSGEIWHSKRVCTCGRRLHHWHGRALWYGENWLWQDNAILFRDARSLVNEVDVSFNRRPLLRLFEGRDVDDSKARALYRHAWATSSTTSLARSHVVAIFTRDRLTLVVVVAAVFTMAISSC